MSDRLHVGIYDMYWSTLGGGEQVAGTIAAVLARDHDVTLLGPQPIDVERTRERLGVDLGGCGFQQVTEDREASAASADFDLFVNGTYLSTAINRAPHGWYYVHFPARPPALRDRARHWTGVAGVKLLGLPRVPARLQGMRARFDQRVTRIEHLPTYSPFLANSQFTAGWVRDLWGVPCRVLYPPVRVEQEIQAVDRTKRPLVLNVGRFFDPRFGHSKRQLEMVQVFKGLRLDGWELALAGGCDPANREYAMAARRAAAGAPVRIHLNARGDVVQQLFAEASIYWLAGGYGADPDRQPERFEHFGIAVVEAMAAGAVPLVHGVGGPAEIVRHGIDGYHWRDLDELADLTRRLSTEPEDLARLAAAARLRAQDFSSARFADEVRTLAGQAC